MTEDWNGWKPPRPEETPEQKAKRIGVPVIGPYKPWVQPNPDPNPIVAVCGQCGMELRQVMGYVCHNNNCPAFARITC